MRSHFPLLGVSSILLALGLPAGLSGATLGQIDDFEDSTTQSWRKGSEIVPPVLTVESEPGGNNVLVLSSTGRGGAGGKMTMLSRSPDQWAGDYVSDGPLAITMDMRNPGETDLFVRMGFTDLFGGSGMWFVTEGTLLPAGSDWVQGSFVLTSDRMQSVNGGQPFETVMSSVREVRIFSSEKSDTHRGDTIVGTLVLDNITLIPEPSAVMLAGLAGLAFLRRRR